MTPKGLAVQPPENVSGPTDRTPRGGGGDRTTFTCHGHLSFLLTHTRRVTPDSRRERSAEADNVIPELLALAAGSLQFKVKR